MVSNICSSRRRRGERVKKEEGFRVWEHHLSNGWAGQSDWLARAQRFAMASQSWGGGGGVGGGKRMKDFFS